MTYWPFSPLKNLMSVVTNNYDKLKWSSELDPNQSTPIVNLGWFGSHNFSQELPKKIPRCVRFTKWNQSWIWGRDTNRLKRTRPVCTCFRKCPLDLAIVTFLWTFRNIAATFDEINLTVNTDKFPTKSVAFQRQVLGQGQSGKVKKVTRFLNPIIRKKSSKSTSTW